VETASEERRHHIARVDVTTRIHTSAPTSAAPGKPAPSTTTSSNSACGTSTSGEIRCVPSTCTNAAWGMCASSATLPHAHPAQLPRRGQIR
jgi:hypothetical protein